MRIHTKYKNNLLLLKIFFFLLITNTLKPDCNVSGLLMGTCLMFKEKNTALKEGITISCVITPLNMQSSMLGMREMRRPTQKKALSMNNNCF